MVVHKKTHKTHLSTTIDARAVRSRAALRHAMLKLLEVRRFEDVTIGDVATAAGVGYSTVCRHYPTLDALLDEIATTEIHHIITRAFPSFHVTDTHSASLALFKYVHEHRTVWRALLMGGAAGALRNEFIKVSMKIASGWKETDAWLPQDLGVTMTVSGTMELMTWWLRKADPLPPERIAAIFERLLVAPVMAEDAHVRKPRAKRATSKSPRR
jgi:AcrR family transcriptional regulator